MCEKDYPAVFRFAARREKYFSVRVTSFSAVSGGCQGQGIRVERILGDGAFVEKVLAQRQEALERRYTLQAQGVDLDYVTGRIAQLLDMARRQVWLPGKYEQQVTARSLLCFWEVRELGLSMTSLAKRLGLSTAAVSKSVRRGAAIVEQNGYTLL